MRCFLKNERASWRGDFEDVGRSWFGLSGPPPQVMDHYSPEEGKSPPGAGEKEEGGRGREESQGRGRSRKGEAWR